MRKGTKNDTIRQFWKLLKSLIPLGGTYNVTAFNIVNIRFNLKFNYLFPVVSLSRVTRYWKFQRESRLPDHSFLHVGHTHHLVVATVTDYAKLELWRTAFNERTTIHSPCTHENFHIMNYYIITYVLTLLFGLFNFLTFNVPL